MADLCWVVISVLSSPRIAVFSVTVLHDDRIVLVAEQRPDASEEDSFQWMSRVLQVGTGGPLLRRGFSGVCACGCRLPSSRALPARLVPRSRGRGVDVLSGTAVLRPVLPTHSGH